MAEVVFDHVTRIYPGNDKPSVDDLNLDIKDGEFLVLVGPSGCGKSTTLRMLAGLEEVNKGRILIGGKDVTTMQPKDRDIAMVFQNYALYPHMTVADNMGFALKIAGTPKEEIRKRVEKAAEILDLTEYLDRKPKALSGGQRQRVAMGRAIVREPKVFLMDEPLSNLDAKLRVQTRTQIAALQRQLGVTTLYVTHDQTEALTMGDRIAVIKLGILQQVGAPTELYDRPANVFVAGFIGSPSMNLNTHPVVNGKAKIGEDTVDLPAEAVNKLTAEDNGLTKQWSGRVWCNPPYAQPLIAEFAEAIASKFEAGEIEQACVLVNNGTETGWFQRMLQAASAVCFPRSRIRFVDPEGNPSGAPLQGQAVLYLGKEPETFASVFSEKGAVLFNG